MHPKIFVRLAKAAHRILATHPAVNKDGPPPPLRSYQHLRSSKTESDLLDLIEGAHFVGRLEACVHTAETDRRKEATEPRNADETQAIGLEKRLEDWSADRRRAGLPALRGDERDDAFVSDLVAAVPEALDLKISPDAVCVAARAFAHVLVQKDAAQAQTLGREIKADSDTMERAAALEGARVVGNMEIRNKRSIGALYALRSRDTFGSVEVARANLSPATDFAAFAMQSAQIGMMEFALPEDMRAEFRASMPVNMAGVHVPLTAFAGDAWALEIDEALDPAETVDFTNPGSWLSTN